MSGAFAASTFLAADANQGPALARKTHAELANETRETGAIAAVRHLLDSQLDVGSAPQGSCCAYPDCRPTEICSSGKCRAMSQGCPLGWTPDNAGGCLKFIATPGDYATQAAACAALWPAHPAWNVPHLVKITSSGVNDAATALCTGPNQCYIGATSPVGEASFVWHDGTSPADYNFVPNWGVDEPDIIGGPLGGFNAAYIIGPSDGTWHVTPPSSMLEAICQVGEYCEVDGNCAPNKVCLNAKCVECKTSYDCADNNFCLHNYCVGIEGGCPSDWLSGDPGTGCLHLIHTHDLPTAQAKNCAEAWPGYPAGNVGHLVKITSAVENAAVSSVCSSYPSGSPVPCYIGLDDSAVEGTFVWYDKTVLTPGTYRNWDSGQPVSVNDYVAINPNAAGKWRTYRDTQAYRAVCQINPFCDKDTHCLENKVCVDNACVDCREDQHCPAAKPYCADNTCVECTFSQDCANDTACVSNACVVVTDGCPPGWTYSSASDTCLRRSDELKTFSGQVATCAELWPEFPAGNGGHLVKITSSAENLAAQQICVWPNMCYIGLNDAATEGTFVWHDDTTPSFPSGELLPWASGEPSADDYVAIYAVTGVWSANPAATPMYGVCQINTICGWDINCPAGQYCVGSTCKGCGEPYQCADNETCIDDVCVVVANGCPDGWTSTAAAGCLRYLPATAGGGVLKQKAICAGLWTSNIAGNVPHLAKIASAAANTEVNTMTDGNTCYIGLSDAVTEGTFLWHDGTVASAATFEYWYPGHPSGGASKNYAYIAPSRGGRWATSDGLEPLPAICQLDKYCDKDSNCPSGKICRSNTCIDCFSDADCDYYDTCIDGSCIGVYNGCPAGWSPMLGGTCIQLASSNLYASHVAACAALWPSAYPSSLDVNPGHLVKITSSDENENAAELCPDVCYIGLSDPEGDLSYAWPDGSIPIYTNFAPGLSPGNFTVINSTNDGYWDYSNGLDNHPAICQIKAFCTKNSQCPYQHRCDQRVCVYNGRCARDKIYVNGVCEAITNGCPSGFTYKGDAGCLAPMAVAFALFYNDAVLNCNALWPSHYPGSANPPHLVKITDSSVNAIAPGSCSALHCFIGLTDTATQGTFLWYDGTPATVGVTYTNWSPGQPNTAAGYDYVYQDAINGKWFTSPTPSNDPTAGICQMKTVCEMDHHCPTGKYCVDNTCSDCPYCEENEVCIGSACIAITNGCPPGFTYRNAAGCLALLSNATYDTLSENCRNLWPSKYPGSDNPAHLMKITSAAANNEAKSVCGEDECFIGLSSPTLGTWVWQDGTAPIYFQWGIDEPSVLVGYDAVYLSGATGWYTSVPSESRKGICQVNPVCAWDSHCPSGQYCVDGTCRACRDSDHCGGSEVCVSYSCLVVANGCPAGWTYTTAAGCLRLLDAPNNLPSQQTICRGLWSAGIPAGNAPHLAKISNGDANAAVKAVCGATYCYIGLSDADNEGTFVWHDGEVAVVNELPWAPGEPSNLVASWDYVIMDPSGLWNAAPGTILIPAVCQLSAFCVKDGNCAPGKVCVDTKCVDCRTHDDCTATQACIANTCVVVTNGCPTGWTSTAAAGCLQLIAPPGQRRPQQDACEAKWIPAYPDENLAHLAKIVSSDANTNVAALCPNQCYIGLSDSQVEGTFVWEDTTAATYFNWMTGNPDSGNPLSDYAYINKVDGKWVSTTDVNLLLAVCQINPFCVKDGNCPTGMFCLEGDCVECQFTIDCPDNKVCVSYACVVDTNPPVISCTEDITRATTAPTRRTPINFAVTADDEESPNLVQLVCTWAVSGQDVRAIGVTSLIAISEFPLGSTNVTCVAIDEANKTDTCSFLVNVECYPGLCSKGEICSSLGCIECCDTEDCTGGSICLENSCVDCINTNFGTGLDLGCDSPLPFCVDPSSELFNTTGPLEAGACVACLDSEEGLVVDPGCDEQMPMCVTTHTVVSTNKRLDAQGALDVTPLGATAECFACRDLGNNTMDYGCTAYKPYCVFDRTEDGYGKGCSEFPNPACLFYTGDIIPDSDIACSTDVAVEARITLTMANCTSTTLNLTAIATPVGSVMNLSSCAIQLDFVSGDDVVPLTRRHLLQQPSGVITLLLFAFVPNDAVGNSIVDNVKATVELAVLLAMVDGNIGEVIDIDVTAAVLHLGSVTTDPHFVTPNGQKFDFNGMAGNTYCIVTDRQLHMNARFMGPAESSLATKAPGGQPDARTWMDQVSILHGGDRVLVDAASPPGTPYTASFGAVHINGKSLAGRAARRKLPSGLTVARKKTRVLVSVPGIAIIEVEAVRAAFWEAGTGPGRNFLNLQVKELNSTSSAHGVLGQAFARKSAGIIEGSPQDYATSGIFATNCLYRQFSRNA